MLNITPDEMQVSEQDRIILRDVAKQQWAWSQTPENKEIEQEWFRHHRFEKGRPMIHLELWTFKKDVIDKRLKCETPLARKIETTLYEQFLNAQLFGDDRVVPDYFPIYWQTEFNLFDIKIEVVHAEDGHGGDLGHQFQYVIGDLRADYHKLKSSTYGVNREATLAYQKVVEEIFGDLLPTKIQAGCLYAVPTQQIVHFMGMENMMMAMMDEPDLFKEMMERVADDTIAYFNWLSQENLILPTTGKQPLGQGTWCYTNELPESLHRPFTPKDVWGFMDSQETVGISPAMFEEFIFPCYEKIAQTFGLLSYGCCEPVHPIWENSLSKLKHLRKVSVSPWCDEVYMGNQLRGEKIVYHRKPSPNYLGVGSMLDEEGLRKHIRTTLDAARGCQLEFTQRDVYTIHEDENKARRYVEIIREEIEAASFVSDIDWDSSHRTS